MKSLKTKRAHLIPKFTEKKPISSHFIIKMLFMNLHEENITYKASILKLFLNFFFSIPEDIGNILQSSEGKSYMPQIFY